MDKKKVMLLGLVVVLTLIAISFGAYKMFSTPEGPVRL